MEAIGYFTTPPVIVTEEQRAKRESDPAHVRRVSADYVIESIPGQVRKYVFMLNNATGEYRSYSRKEFDALKTAGKNIVTDF